MDLRTITLLLVLAWTATSIILLRNRLKNETDNEPEESNKQMENNKQRQETDETTEEMPNEKTLNKKTTKHRIRNQHGQHGR